MTEHALHRVNKRYNQDISRAELSALSFEIFKGNSLFLEEVDKYLSFHYVQLRNIPYKVLYSSRTRISPQNYINKPCIVTVYPFIVDEYNLLVENYNKQYLESIINELKDKGYTVLDKEGQEV